MELTAMEHVIKKIIDAHSIYFEVIVNPFRNSFTKLLFFCFICLVIGLLFSFFRPHKAHFFAGYSILVSECFLLLGAIMSGHAGDFEGFFCFIYIGLQLILFYNLIYFSKKATRIPALLLFIFSLSYSFCAFFYGAISLSGDSL